MNEEFLLNNKEFRGFCIYRLIFGISYSLLIPIIPLFFKSIGMGTVTIGIIISLYGVSKTLIQIPFGIISNNIGDKLTLKFLDKKIDGYEERMLKFEEELKIGE